MNIKTQKAEHHITIDIIFAKLRFSNFDHTSYFYFGYNANNIYVEVTARQT